MANNKDQQQPINDIQDSEKDKLKLQPDEATLDLPDVEDIPGQENIRPPRLNEMADTTISSDDEEGKGVLDEQGEEENEFDVSDSERELLQHSSESMDSQEDKDTRNAMLDNEDADGDPLNERVEASGDDLDVPGAEDDDDNEAIGEEDEENNNYSLGGDDND